MFSNVKQGGKLIAENDEEYIYLHKNKAANEYESNDGSKIEIIPDYKAREVVFIAGSSGSGKSTYASKYTEKWLKIFNDEDKNECYLFSRKHADPVFDKQKRIKRVMIDEKLITDPINVTTDFNPNTLLIFDDIDSLPLHLYKAIVRIITDVLEVGRSYRVYCIVINHLLNPNSKALGRVLHNESHYIVVFKNDNDRALKYFLESYMGYNKKQIDGIINMDDNTRAITIHRQYPKYIISDERIWKP